MSAAPTPAATAPAPGAIGPIGARKDVRLAAASIVLLVLAGAVLLALQPSETKPQALPQVPPDAAGQALLPLPAPAPLPGPDPVSSPPRLDRVEERVDALHRTMESVTAQLGEVNTRLVALIQQGEALQGQVEALAARPVPAATPRRPAARKPAAAPKPKTPAVVAIDTWGNDPSAAIRDLNGNLAFYREGEAVGLARIQRIDPHLRQVHLRLPDGTVATVGVQP